MFGTEDLMTNIRTLAVYGEGQGILNYSAVINQALFVVALWAHPKVPLWQVVMLGIACLMNSLAIMEKGLIFFVFVSTMFVLFEKRVIRKRTILTFSALIIVLFYIFNLGRAGSGSEYQEEETLFDFFTMYALSPPVAFSQLSEEVIPQFGTNTFETIYLFLKRLGADVVVKDKLQEFVFVPVSTNVYTIFQPFYIDFGYRGVALFAAIYGYACGWLYRLFRSGHGSATCLYSYGVYVMLLQFYQENVFLSMVFVLQFTFFIVLFTTQSIKFQLTPSSV
jgi:oligosaccharide repeat unit polymerase